MSFKISARIVLQDLQLFQCTSKSKLKMQSTDTTAFEFHYEFTTESSMTNSSLQQVGLSVEKER